MRRYGQWKLAGIEIDARAAAYAVDRFDLEAFNGQVEEAPWPARSFDVVTLWDVLEHLSNEQRIWTDIARLLRPAIVLAFKEMGEKPLLNSLFSIGSKIGIIPKIKSFKIPEFEHFFIKENFSIISVRSSSKK